MARTWNGLLDSRQAFLYTWMDGSMVTYTNWYQEPVDKDMKCTFSMEPHGMWFEARCNDSYKVVCKKPAGKEKFPMIPFS